MAQPKLSRLALAGLASAASVPITVLGCVIALGVAASTEGLDSRGAIGVVLLAQETWRGLARAAPSIAGVSFVLLPAAAILTSRRPGFGFLLLPSLGAIVGMVVAAQDDRHAAVVGLGALAGSAAGGVFAFVGREG